MEVRNKVRMIVVAAFISLGFGFVWAKYCAPFLMHVFHVTH